MLSALWELILLDLKGKENLKWDSRWVVTQSKLALLTPALIKYQREALAALCSLAKGETAGLSSSLMGPCFTTDSLSRNTACAQPQELKHSTASTTNHCCRYSEQEGTTLSFCLTLFLHTPPPSVAEREVLFEVSLILLFSFFPLP